MEQNQDPIGDQPWGDEPWGDEPIGDEPMPVAAAAGTGPATTDDGGAAAVMAGPAVQASPAAFGPLTANGPSTDTAGIDLLLDVALQLSVELGRTRMKISDILALRSGSVVELDKLAGEPADILINGTLIARGEVVVVDEKFGVRVMEVVSRAKRLASIG